jgi:hypothetical protein
MVTPDNSVPSLWLPLTSATVVPETVVLSSEYKAVIPALQLPAAARLMIGTVSATTAAARIARILIPSCYFAQQPAA